jgi:hypothetical protein
MPRRERQVRPKAIMGSARSYGGRKGRKDSARGGEEFQRAAWDFYDLVPDFGQAANIEGALISRAKLIVEERDADGVWAKTKNPIALAALDEFYGGEEGHPEFLRLCTMHLTVAGEGWTISPMVQLVPLAAPEDWQVAAATEVVLQDGNWRVNGKPLDGERMGLRIWRAHPVNKKKADTPARRLLSTLSQYVQLQKRISAQIDSRLTGAGVWLIPAETSFPAQPMQQLNAGDPITHTDAVAAGDAQGLADLMLARAQIAIENPESAAATIPLIGEVPGEYIEKIRDPVTFWSELDKVAPQIRAELRETIARCTDIPPEVLLGGIGSNHWQAWLSDENNIKIHAEPTLKIITSGLTTQYLWKALEGEVGNVRNFRIGADTSEMRLRPNRSQEALELNDRMILSDKATLRENGFTEADMMDKEELKLAVLKKMASGSTTPEIVAIAARMIGVDFPQITDNREPAEARPTPSLEDHPSRTPPEQENPAGGATAGLHPLVFVAEQIVDRALQRAGNRIKVKYGIKSPPCGANRLYQHVDIAVGDLDDLLLDAWDACQLGDYGVDPVVLSRALDFYTRALMKSRREPTRATISTALKLFATSKAA